MAEAEMSSASRRILAVALEGETAILSSVVKGELSLYIRVTHDISSLTRSSLTTQ
jgi:hypothetical protein